MGPEWRSPMPSLTLPCIPSLTAGQPQGPHLMWGCLFIWGRGANSSKNSRKYKNGFRNVTIKWHEARETVPFTKYSEQAWGPKFISHAHIKSKSKLRSKCNSIPEEADRGASQASWIGGEFQVEWDSLSVAKIESVWGKHLDASLCWHPYVHSHVHMYPHTWT